MSAFFHAVPTRRRVGDMFERLHARVTSPSKQTSVRLSPWLLLGMIAYCAGIWALVIVAVL